MIKLQSFALLILLILTPWAAEAAPVADADTGSPAFARWADVPALSDEDAFCFGANASGTRFLIGEYTERTPSGPAFEVYIIDLQTGERKALAPSGRLIGQPISVETRGDFILVLAAGSGYMLIDTQTGQAMLLDGNATLSENGCAAVYSPDKISMYDPRTGAYSRVALKTPKENRILAARFLSDDTAVCVTRAIDLQQAAVAESRFAFYGANGAEIESIDAGRYKFGAVPDRLLYSERMDVGIAYNLSSIAVCPPRIFRKGSETASVLWLHSVNATHAEALNPADVLDEVGSLAVKAECVLLPLGLSRDESSVLLVEMDSASLLQMRLDTLEVRTLLTYEDMKALYAQKSIAYDAPLFSLSTLGWNGANLLAGWGLPPRCALSLPIE